MKRTLDTLKKGEKTNVVGYLNENIALPLIEMGLFPGAEVEMFTASPFNNPIYYKVEGCGIAIRIDDAKNVLISND